MKAIPGTNIPLCLCCEDEPAARADSALGPVCAVCIPHLAAATVALADAGLLRPKSHSKSQSK